MAEGLELDDLKVLFNPNYSVILFYDSDVVFFYVCFSFGMQNEECLFNKQQYTQTLLLSFYNFLVIDLCHTCVYKLQAE